MSLDIKVTYESMHCWEKISSYITKTIMQIKEDVTSEYLTSIIIMFYSI